MAFISSSDHILRCLAQAEKLAIIPPERAVWPDDFCTSFPAPNHLGTLSYAGFPARDVRTTFISSSYHILPLVSQAVKLAITD